MKKLVLITIILTTLLPQMVAANGSVYLPNPIKCDTLMCVIIDLLRLLLGAVGVFGVAMFIIGGFYFILSGGNENMIKKGKDTMLYSTIGVVAVIISWIIIRTIVSITSQGTF